MGLHKGLHKGLNLPRVRSKRDLSKEAYEVLRLLASEGYYPLLISRLIRKSRTTFYNHLENLVVRGLYNLEHKELTNEGMVVLGSTEGGKKFRSHAYEVYYLLPEGFDKKEWKSKRGIVLTKNEIQWKPKVLKSKQGNIQDDACTFYFDNLQAVAYANGVYVWFPPEVADTPSEAARLQVDRIVKHAPLLSNIFKGIDFIKNNRLNIQIRKSELAHMGDEIAHELRQEERKLYVFVGKELRVICDFSNNIDEWETITVAHGVTDHHALETYKDDIAKHGSLKEFTKDLAESKNLEEYVRDIITHKPEEMPKHENGIFLPSEVVLMFAKQAKVNTELSNQIRELKDSIKRELHNGAK